MEIGMDKGRIYIYLENAEGEAPAAWGRAVQAAAAGRSVVMIRFLKGKKLSENAFVRRMEPEIRLFHFEKSGVDYGELPEEKKKEEGVNIRNGLGYARKVLSVAECDLLILDGVLRLIEQEIISAEDLRELLESRHETDVILTGGMPNEEIRILADEILRTETLSCRANENR